jgi:hypothetical protein
VVDVTEAGVVRRGRRYRSLSAAARAITGTRWSGPRFFGLLAEGRRSVSGRRTIRCAIYTRKSSEEGLEQRFNSLDAQHAACASYVAKPKA